MKLVLINTVVLIIVSVFGIGVESQLVSFRNFGVRPDLTTAKIGPVEYSPSMTTVIACARLCSEDSDCESYLWDENTKTCSTQDTTRSVSGLPDTIRPAIGQLALYSSTVRCNLELGYEIRIQGMAVLCVLMASDRQHYNEAVSWCGRLDGVLVKANTKTKMDIVIGLYYDKAVGHLKQNDLIGTSLNSRADKGIYVWRDGRRRTLEERQALSCSDKPITGRKWGAISPYHKCYDDVGLYYRWGPFYFVCEMI